MGLKEINKDQSDGMVLKEKNSKGERGLPPMPIWEDSPTS